jgi:hypothetical protein
MEQENATGSVLLIDHGNMLTDEEFDRYLRRWHRSILRDAPGPGRRALKP